MTSKRAEQIAADMYEYGGVVWSITKLKDFLNVDRGVAANVCAGLQPVVGQNTGKRYYYRDLAEALSNGGR